MKRHKNSPELSLLKFLPLTYHHSHFLAATLDFTSFFTIAFLRAAHFFLQLGCFGLDMLMCYNLLESGLLDSAWILFEKNFRMPPEVALLRFIYFVGVHM